MIAIVMVRLLALFLLLASGCRFDPGGPSLDVDGGAGGADSGNGDATRPDAAGCADQSLSFQGNQWVRVESNPLLEPSAPFAVGANIWPTTIQDEYQVVSHHDHGAEQGYVLLIKNTNVEFRIYRSNNVCYCVHSGSPQVPTNRWSHLAGSFDSGTARIYLDGQVEQQCNCGSSPADSYDGPMMIGSQSFKSGGSSNFEWQGRIDDVTLRSTRPPDTFDVGAFSSCNGFTVVLYDFNGSGDTARDVCGSGLDGSLGSKMGPDQNDPTRVDDCP